MKRLLLLLPVVALLAAGIAGCTQQREWTHEQRKAMRDAMRNYRRMVYLENLDDAEFALFADDVSNTLEGAYPVYTTFIEMPGVEDTVDMVVVTTIVDELDANAHNMRHLYPYEYLVAQGMLPAGLDRQQQKAFYQCFASKVNNAYTTMAQFFNAVLADTTDNSRLSAMQAACAADLFNWTVEIDIVETD